MCVLWSECCVYVGEGSWAWAGGCRWASSSGGRAGAAVGMEVARRGLGVQAGKWWWEGKRGGRGVGSEACRRSPSPSPPKVPPPQKKLGASYRRVRLIGMRSGVTAIISQSWTPKVVIGDQMASCGFPHQVCKESLGPLYDLDATQIIIAIKEPT